MTTTLFQPVTIVLLMLVTTAAITDASNRRIPNWLTGAGVLAGLLLNSLLHGWAGLGASATGLAVGFGFYFLLYCLRAMGAGDVKLMAAVGALVGMEKWFAIFLVTAIVGGVAAVVLTVYKRRFHTTLWNVAFIAGELAHFRVPFVRNCSLDVKDPGALTLPHGVAIAVGTLVAAISAFHFPVL